MKRARGSSWGIRILLGVVCGWALGLAAVAQERSSRAEWLARKAACDQDYQRQLADLAQRLESQGQANEAAAARRWGLRQARDRHYILWRLPRQAAKARTVPAEEAKSPRATPAAGDLDAPQTHATETQPSLDSLRKQQAGRLWQLAREAKDAGLSELSLHCLAEILREDRTHGDARPMFEELGWLSARVDGAEPRARISRVRHAELRWLPNQYWYVDTPHYRVITNHSAQAGIALGKQLEQVHAAWRHLFVRYWMPREQWERLWDGQAKPARAVRTRHHRVVLFANRDQYLQHLRPAVPQVDITLGMYRDGNQTAYFYIDPEDRSATWRHEATHQLFHELGRGNRDIGARQNFWVVEGIAMYLESLRDFDDYLTVGGFDAARMQYARYRALSDKFYMPLAQLVTLSREQLQTADNIRRLYSQSAGLTHFLMDGQQGEHRDALVEYLREIYLQRDDGTSLARLTKVSLEELDRRYAEFLQVDDEDLACLPEEPVVRQLALGRTRVSDQGLEAVARQTRLTWLDLTDDAAGDATVTQFANLKELKQLNLEGTRITDRSLEAIGQLTQLEELDLSHTEITDEGLQHLTRLSNLTTLWLTGTRITDRGLHPLRTLKTLKTLDLAGTNVTEAGLRELRPFLPQWEPLAPPSP